MRAMTRKGKHNANRGLRVTTACHCELSDCNTCTTLVREGDSEGGCVHVRTGWVNGDSVLPASFCYKPKTALRNKIYYKTQSLWSGFSYLFKTISASFSPCDTVLMKPLCFFEPAMFLFASEPLPVSSDLSSSVASSCHPLSFTMLNVLSRASSLPHSKFWAHLAHCNISSAGHKKPEPMDGCYRAVNNLCSFVPRSTLLLL